MGWSANNSTFEALACDLPVVTLPGPLMRQRHCAAILMLIGLTETIAKTLDEYVEIASDLGRDIQVRRNISGKIKDQKNRAYMDKECIKALESFLERIVDEKGSII
jgi:protein O-GlcNAc transferase